MPHSCPQSFICVHPIAHIRTVPVPKTRLPATGTRHPTPPSPEMLIQTQRSTSQLPNFKLQTSDFKHRRHTSLRPNTKLPRSPYHPAPGTRRPAPGTTSPEVLLQTHLHLAVAQLQTSDFKHRRHTSLSSKHQTASQSLPPGTRNHEPGTPHPCRASPFNAVPTGLG